MTTRRTLKMMLLAAILLGATAAGAQQRFEAAGRVDAVNLTSGYVTIDDRDYALTEQVLDALRSGAQNAPLQKGDPVQYTGEMRDGRPVITNLQSLK